MIASGKGATIRREHTAADRTRAQGLIGSDADRQAAIDVTIPMRVREHPDIQRKEHPMKFVVLWMLGVPFSLMVLLKLVGIL
jgi:hypothetical protein